MRDGEKERKNYRDHPFLLIPSHSLSLRPSRLFSMPSLRSLRLCVELFLLLFPVNSPTIPVSCRQRFEIIFIHNLRSAPMTTPWQIGVFTSIDAGLGVHLDVAQELGIPTVQVHSPHGE